jgi:FkbM family methyltransferase
MNITRELLNAYKTRDRGILSDAISPLLQTAGEKIHLIDGGAGRADLTRFWRSIPSELLVLYGFDPDAADCERLNAEAKAHGVDHRFYGCGLSDRPGERTLHIATGDSSLFPTNHALVDRWSYNGNIDMAKHMKAERSVRVPCTTLDLWRAEHQISPIDFIKLNVQASELDILKGAERSLGSVLGLQLEASFVQTYVGQPLFSDLDQFVRAQGFTFFDFLAPNQVGRKRSPLYLNVPQHIGIFRWPSKQIFEGHFLWLRDPLASPAAFSNEQLLKLVCIAEVYGQVEYAFELLDLVRERAALAGNTPLEQQSAHLIRTSCLLYQHTFA